MSIMRPEHRPLWPAEIGWPEERFDRLFQDMLRDVFTGGTMLERLFERRPGLLHVEEYVEDGTCVIRTELPGIDPDKDLEINVEEGVLHIHARREERKEEERPTGYRSEFHYGSYHRDVRFPEGTTGAEVKATYEDGILEVRIPVPETVAQPSVKIPVQHK